MAEVTVLKRGMVVEVNLDPTVGSETGKTRPCVVVTNDVYNERVPVIQVVPITASSAKKAEIITNIELNPSKGNGLSKESIADCLQTRPIDRLHRLVGIRGELSPAKLAEINRALKIVFALS
ncbi:MAG: type II toxin-antitoxin system PemK/MazF family toxin [Candidatus Bipolaricaulota bacterium]|nr:type II toxin-antitoxin system PemK/MazF family toxin [Candidatus Bipolaricaulota bacterium]